MAKSPARGADFVAKIVKDPKNPPATVMLTGFLGASSEPGHTRLYFDPHLSTYVEIPDDAILHTQDVPAEGGLEATHVWIRQDAQLIYGPAGSERPKGTFLEGPIMQAHMPAAAAAAAGGAGGAAALPNTFGFVCPTLVTPCRPTLVGPCLSLPVVCNPRTPFVPCLPTPQCTLPPGCPVLTQPPGCLPHTFPPICGPVTLPAQCGPLTLVGGCHPPLTPNCPILSAPHACPTFGPCPSIAGCPSVAGGCPIGPGGPLQPFGGEAAPQVAAAAAPQVAAAAVPQQAFVSLHCPDTPLGLPCHPGTPNMPQAISVFQHCLTRHFNCQSVVICPPLRTPFCPQLTPACPVTPQCPQTPLCPQLTPFCPQLTPACPHVTPACPQLTPACPFPTAACPFPTAGCPFGLG